MKWVSGGIASSGWASSMKRSSVVPVVVVEHRRLEVELRELADPAQGRLGLENQVLVADLGVVPKARCLLACALDPLPPAFRDPSRRGRVDGALAAGEGHVAPVA